MAQVFLSYDREDAAKARAVAQALERAGHFVWWDLHIKGGAEYGKVIEEALWRADAVVVLWSERSVESPWVRDEAAAGRDRGRLVPVQLDQAPPPMGFRQYQTIGMSGWKGRGRVPRLNELLDAVDGLGSSETAAVAPSTVTKSTERSRRLLPIGLAAVAVAALAALLFFWQPWAQRSATPVVAVVAAEPTPDTNALARELLVQLGKLQATNPDALSLVRSASENSDLILEVSAGVQPTEATANLVLLEGKGRTLLWSKDYSQPAARQADLRQQVAYSAAQVLRCAGQAMSADGASLDDETQALYLKGCAEHAESSGTDLAAVLPIFERVTASAPRFRPGWAKLLLVSNDAASTFSPFGDSAPKHAIRRHIADAQKRFPDMAEILLAKTALLPRGAYAERLNLADRAKRLAPADPNILINRSHELMNVGRMNESLADTDRALQLDPLSPTARNAFISMLAYSGRLGRAEEALKEAERLWPGSSSLVDAKFRFHLRYGDPQVALGILREEEGTSRLHETFLRARIDPSPKNVEDVLSLARAALRRFQEVGGFGQALAEFGREDELFSTLSRFQGDLAESGFEVYFRPTFDKVREDPRFMQLAHRAGLVDYWRKSRNWPDFCFEPDLPYDCKKEAAKLM